MPVCNKVGHKLHLACPGRALSACQLSGTCCTPRGCQARPCWANVCCWRHRVYVLLSRGSNVYSWAHAACLSRARLQPGSDIGAAVGACTLLAALARVNRERCSLLPARKWFDTCSKSELFEMHSAAWPAALACHPHTLHSCLCRCSCVSRCCTAART